MRSLLLSLPLALVMVGCQSEDRLGVDSEVVSQAQSHISENQDAALAGAEEDFSVRDVVVDDDGAAHVRMDRWYRGLPVLGGDVVVHSDNAGRFQSFSMTLGSRIALDTTPALATEDARAIAADVLEGRMTAEPEADLVVYARGEVPVLAYEVLVTGMKADATPSELHVLVDAQTGEILDRWDGVMHASAAGTGKGFFSGTVSLTTNSTSTGYELKDPSRGNLYTIDMKSRSNGGSIFTDSDNVWGNGSTSDNATIAVDAQYGTAVTWDYYLNIHGRNGIANNGVGAYNRVHYSRKYNNAFWSDSCFCMTYGDGDGTTFNPFDSLDVAGHEMSHGVTSRTSNLTYSGESGGLNEANSDIFGTMVEYYANNASDAGDYLIGEKLYKSGNGALRYMYNPDLDGYSKGCYVSTLGKLDVHYSSGVANHFFYLLAEGSTSASTNTCSTGLSVTGIGRSKAELIWYRALTVYMTSSTNYAGARTATLSAAADLYGNGSVEYNEVANAWSAVKVN